ncbi:hypothetical protein [Lactiplantibacillus paraxiangfangensis]|uniref:hypothetical protein n=1 Tax=Lactiplantibacillus paraxiangfangensis TaxID=3076224 RepID=UPI0030C77341
MSEKLVLKRQTDNGRSGGVKPVFVNDSVLDIVREIKNETGIPMGRLVERFIEYAAKNIEIIDEKDGD